MCMSCHYLSISLQQKISSRIQEYSKWFIFHHMFISWRLMIRDDWDTEVKFEIWDTAGQERFRSLAPMYYRRETWLGVVINVVMLYGRHQDGMFIKVDCYGLLWLVNTCNILYGFDWFSRHGIVIYSPIPGVVQNELKEREWKRRTQAPITFQLLEVCGTLDLPCQTYVCYRPWQNWSWTIASWQISRHDFQSPVTLL